VTALCKSTLTYLYLVARLTVNIFTQPRLRLNVDCRCWFLHTEKREQHALEADGRRQRKTELDGDKWPPTGYAAVERQAIHKSVKSNNAYIHACIICCKVWLMTRVILSNGVDMMNNSDTILLAFADFLEKPAPSIVQYIPDRWQNKFCGYPSS